MEIRIDDEFKSLVPPLTEEEFKQLEQNIIAEGCRDALVVWDNAIIDGHNRYKICTKHNIEYKIIEMQFDNREQAINWIIDNQLGRRNITKEQRDYLIGVRYRREKKSREDNLKQFQAVEPKGQNVPSVTTAEKIAQQYDISEKTVKRAEKFADGVDKIAEVAPEVKQEILQGKSDFTKTEVMSLANAEPEVVVERIKEKKKPHVVNNSGNNEWYTPVEYIEAARMVMGEIELDPASSELANQTVQAGRFFTAQDDGLKHDWYGKVWMNPPYASNLIGQFCTKLATHYYKGDVTEAIVLVNNATETAWFNTLIEHASAVVFPRARVKFVMPNGSTGAPLQGQSVIYLGKNPQLFMAKFKQFGWGAYL